MFKKIKTYFVKLRQAKEQKAKLLQAQKYYKILREGALFIKYINDDLTNTKNATNRHTRRRMEKSLRKGEITSEIVNHYQQKIDLILKEIELRLNPPKIEKKNLVDGAKMYKELKKKEGKK